MSSHGYCLFRKDSTVQILNIHAAGNHSKYKTDKYYECDKNLADKHKIIRMNCTWWSPLKKQIWCFL